MGCSSQELFPWTRSSWAPSKLPPVLIFIMILLYKLENEAPLRYLPGLQRHFSVPKSSRWLRAVLPMYDAARRSAFIRVNDEVFEVLIRVIKNSVPGIFKKGRGPPQHSVRLQVAIGLTKIGSYGNAASAGRIAALFGVSEGFATVATSRTILAQNKIAPLLIKWPGRRRRKQLSHFADTNFGFKGAIGSTDGTTIPLFKAPSIVPWSFFDRKSRYSLHALVTVDHDYRVIDIVVNYLGPAPDSIVQRAAFWHRSPDFFFAEGEYLLGDKGMLLSLQCVIPYKGKEAKTNDNANFTTQHARLRIIAEQVIGQVKTRFASLKELRLQIEVLEDVKRGGQWIIAAFVLHNLCVKMNDYRRPADNNSFRNNQPCPDSIQPEGQSPAEEGRTVTKQRVIQFMRGHNTYITPSRIIATNRVPFEGVRNHIFLRH